MDVAININGRQALPVRAIPLLTDWQVLYPDQLAQILAGDSDHWPSFDGLTAYRLHSDGSTELIPPRWWASWVVRELKATSDGITAKQTSHETGYQQWRGESLAQLPGGVFLWRDEFEAAHANEYGPKGIRARSNPKGFDPSSHALEFNPQHGPGDDWRNLVMEGFEQLTAPSASRNLEQLWFVRAFYGAGDNDAHWSGLRNLLPKEAAALLCGRDPLVNRGCDAQCVALLTRRLTDYNKIHPARRSWREWHSVAKEIEADYEKGFDDFFAEQGQTTNTSATGGIAQLQTPAPVVAESPSGVIHSTKARRNTLTPVIELAQSQCRNPQDTAEVWAALLVLAELKHPPLRGATEDGVQYLKRGEVAFLTRDALRKRLAVKH